MPGFIDQTGRKVSLPGHPERIISLVPSQTELLFDLGLNKEVVGITKFCVHPGEWFRTKTRVGGTKQANISIIHQLQPDLILVNKEENVKEQILELEKLYPVWISDIRTLHDACEMISQVGMITGTQQRANNMTGRIKEVFTGLPKPAHKPATAYLVWQKPYMTVGNDTFIHAMLEAAGFDNVFKNELRYPETTLEKIREKGTEILLLASEPFPFTQKHAGELQPLLPGTKIIPVDGEMFSWYGSRLLRSPSYFSQLQESLKIIRS